MIPVFILFRNAVEERNLAGESFRVFDAQLTKKKKIYAYIHMGPRRSRLWTLTLR